MKRLLLIFAVLVLGAWTHGVAPPQNMVWERLKIGDGGFGARMNIANDGTRTLNTDISNAYIWGSGDTKWRSCVNIESLRAAGYVVNADYAYYSPWDFQIAPSNSNRVYMLYGGNSQPNGTLLFRSDDSCHSWVVTSFVGTTYGADFATARGGQRIVVDPANADVVYVGSSVTGKVYRTLNAGTTFSVVTDGSGNDLPAEQNFLLANSGSAVSDWNGTTTLSGVTVSKEVFINAYGFGVWHSSDGGATFTQISTPTDITMPVTVPSIPNGAMVFVTAVTCAENCSITPTIKTPTSPHLTFTFRSSYTEGGGGRRFASYWAVNGTGGTLTNEVVTANYNPSGSALLTSISAVVFTGQNASPFDGSTATGSASPPTVTTTVNDTIVVALQLNDNTTPIAGYTCATPCGNVAPTNDVSLLYTTTPYTSTQTVTPSLTGAGLIRGGVADVIKAATPASLALVSATINRDSSTVVYPTVPYLGWYGKVSCNGTYYSGQAVSAGVWKWKSGSWTLLAPPDGSSAFMAYPYAAASGSADCDKIFVAFGLRITVFNTSTDAGATWNYVSNKQSTGACQNMTQSAPTVPWYQNPWWQACDSPVPPGQPPMNSLDLGDAQFNPVTHKLEFATGFCYYTATIPFTNNATFDYTESCAGPESVVTSTIMSVPGGHVHFGVLDLGMFWDLSTTAYPTQRGPQFQLAAALTGCTSFSYVAQHPTYVFSLCNEAGGVDTSGYTTTGGTDYTKWFMFGQLQNSRGQQTTSNTPLDSSINIGGDISANACDINNVIIRQGGNVGTGAAGNIARTTNALAADGVVAWTVVDPATAFVPSITSAQIWNIVPDKGLVPSSCDKFYAYVYTGANQGVYASTDKGVTWTQVFNGVLFSVNQGGAYIDAVPNSYNELYGVSGYTFGDKPLANTVLKHSTDGGANWATCPGIQNPFSFGFGAGPGNNANNPSIFVIGYSTATPPVYGVYRSDDDCQTWSRLTTNSAAPYANWKEELYMNSPQPTGDKWVTDGLAISGDMNVYGKVYIGLRPGAGFTQGTLQ